MTSQPQVGTTTPQVASSTTTTGALSLQPATITAAISEERLAPYLLESGGHAAKAFTLYRWNLALSAAVQERLGIFEIALRNAMDEQVRAWQLAMPEIDGIKYGENWIEKPHPYLSDSQDAERLSGIHQKAIGAIKGKNRDLTHGDCVAKTTLGTWRFMLPGTHTKVDRTDSGNEKVEVVDEGFRGELWKSHMHKAFPYLGYNVSAFRNEVNSIWLLRNRVAHHEPLLDTETVWKTFLSMKRVMHCINPELNTWIEYQSRVIPLLQMRKGI